MKTMAISCLKLFQLKQHLNNAIAQKDKIGKPIEYFKTKETLLKCKIKEVHTS